jgi:dTDP-glucose 4,6-dehydratase
MIQNLIDQKPLPVYGKGENIRDWLYVEDHAQAIDLILHRGKLGETYAIGGNNEKQNIELVRLLISLLDKKLNRPEGASLSLLTFVTDRLGHDYRYAIDTTKIELELGWKPTTSFEEGMEKTVDFYLQK